MLIISRRSHTSEAAWLTTVTERRGSLCYLRRIINILCTFDGPAFASDFSHNSTQRRDSAPVEVVPLCHLSLFLVITVVVDQKANQRRREMESTSGCHFSPIWDEKSSLTPSFQRENNYMGTPDAGNFDSFDTAKSKWNCFFYPKAFDFFATNSIGNTIVNK